MNKLLDKLKFGQHHRIERFGISFIILSFLLILIFTTAIINKRNFDKKVFQQTAIYTQNFTTSRTNAKGSVEGLYRTKDKTKVFLMLKFDNINNVSAHAEDYQMFMTPYKVAGNDKKWSEKPSASIYSFGTTGYFGVYFVNEKGFDPQILQLTFRANSEIVPITATVKDETGDETFKEHDQFRIIFNPGATEINETAVLDKDKLDVMDVFEEFVIKPKEKEIKEDLAKQLDVMRTNLNAISEYERRVKALTLDEKGIIIPNRLVAIGDDKIESKDDKLYLDTKYRFKTGFDYNWQDGNVSKGYFKGIADGKSPFDFLKERSKEEINSDDFTTSKLKFLLTDGSDFNDLLKTQGDVGVVKDASATVGNLVKAYDEYIMNKKNYQIKTLRQLLDLELNKSNVKDNHTVNTSDNVLRLY